MPKILITGKDSFVGTNFRRFSAHREIDEVSLIENKPEDINFSSYDIVLHLAAIVHQSVKIDEAVYFRVNCELALKVAAEAKRAGVKQFIYLSTLKVFGNTNPSGKLRNELSPCFPDDSYGKSKYTAEKKLTELGTDKFRVAIVRPPMVYGIGVRANMLGIIKLVYHSPMLPFAGINNRRNFIYAENLAGYIDRIIEKEAEGIFIATDENAISTTVLVRLISESMSKKTRLFRLPGFAISIGSKLLPFVFDRLFDSLEFDNSMTRETLDYTPEISTMEGIKRTVAAFIAEKKNPS